MQCCPSCCSGYELEQNRDVKLLTQNHEKDHVSCSHSIDSSTFHDLLGDSNMHDERKAASNFRV